MLHGHRRLIFPIGRRGRMGKSIAWKSGYQGKLPHGMCLAGFQQCADERLSTCAALGSSCWSRLCRVGAPSFAVSESPLAQLLPLQHVYRKSLGIILICLHRDVPWTVNCIRRSTSFPVPSRFFACLAQRSSSGACGAAPLTSWSHQAART